MPNKVQNKSKTKQVSDVATATTTRYTKTKVAQQTSAAAVAAAAAAVAAAAASVAKPPQQPQPATANILNVAEMLLHGVADHEILDIWLRSISCQEFAANFQRAGYDMPTISRITPQDLTAIGITDPAKRLKILSEIKKLNLQDGIPNFRPASLSHWLSLLRLDSDYYKSLCDQQIDTIDKMCQLTWEDFDELGIIKLGHQKRLLLAIERIKAIDADDAKAASKTISEPIYDTNPSQILLVASAENHSMNGPIINKQSSTSELSSTGSGSMHSVYSSASAHYQPNYSILPSMSQQPDQNLPTQQQQAIYGQHPHPAAHPSQTMPSQPPPPRFDQHPGALPSPSPSLHQHHHTSHYQAGQPIMAPPQFANPIYETNPNAGRNTNIPPPNRQSMGQLPFSALANLPKHQLQLLQQSSIYATLSRQPQRAKLPPPPVPIRTNSLKSDSLVNDEANIRQSQQPATPNASNLMRSGTIVSNRTQYNSQTLLSKNRSFSGNAYMEAARARFLDRNNLSQNSLAQQMPKQTIEPATHIGVDSSIPGGRQTGSSQDSGSSQTLYNSASSGINDHNLNMRDFSPSGDLMSQHSSASSATLHDVNLIFEQQHLQQQKPHQQQQQQQQPRRFVQQAIDRDRNNPSEACKAPDMNHQCDATTGEDSSFPPPPSPLSLTDSDEYDLLALSNESRTPAWGSWHLTLAPELAKKCRT